MLNLALSAITVLLLLATIRAQTVRLVGGPSPREGRLEVYYNGTWGTVCDDEFTDAAARVVCYMLGYNDGQDIGNRYGAGSGTIWLDDVRCTGTETNIGECRHRSWGSHNCGHSEDVSVSCNTTVRLVGGPSPQEGRLEIHYNGTWRTVCRNYFDNAEAKVVCFMLGYGYIGHVSGNLHGAGVGTSWNLYDSRCSGTEENIADCHHGRWRTRSCNYVSVSCFTEVKLVGDSGSKGCLEVYHNGTWGTVCDGGFTNAAARVVCSMLGYGYTGRLIGNLYGAGSGTIWLDNVQCNGNEKHIAHCPHNSWGRHNCSHSDDVSISCIADSAEAVVLVGGGNPRVGRLEVFHGTQWGTVCDDGFTHAAARVVCFSLGFGYVGRKVDINIYGVGDGLIWLSNISCNGSEQYIGECSHNCWGIQNGYCEHHQDVAVSCTGNRSAANVNDSTTAVTPVRLVGGANSTGRLEILHDGVWGTVCGDLFAVAEARVVCKMLGLDSGTKTDNSNYITNDGPIWHNCHHREDVAVSCARVEVRLNGGRDPREGRLEVFYNGFWGSVCPDGSYDDRERLARVVCNMLGFGYYGRSINNYINGYVFEPFWLESVSCSGTEKNVAECQHNGWGVSNCNYRTVQSVSCLTYYSVALFGGGNLREGRLEVYYSNTWGTVCDDGFTDAAARVVCYSLGFGYVGREMNISVYGVGKEKIWFDDVDCEGTEKRITGCSHRGWGVQNCGHNEDVAVACYGDPSAASNTTSAAQSVRLVRSSIAREGRLEIHYNGTWRTVCRDYFDNAEARVVCFMLGYGYVGHDSGNLGASYRTSWYLYNSRCSGTEANITDCRHRGGWITQYCNYVSVSCFTEVKLIGDSGSKGRLEVYHSGTWGTVCDDGFTDAAARVVCSMLGYTYTGRLIGNQYGASSGTIWLDNVQCNGNEKHIAHCPHDSWGRHNCTHSDDVSISCIADSAEAVALVGGGNPRVGRLEVFHGTQWGTVCDEGFTDAAARVVCFSLGFGYVGRKVDINLYGVGDGLIWLRNISCIGTEQHIGECLHSDWGIQNSYCGHHEDVAVSCTDNTSASNLNDSITAATPVRLVGGSNSTGRLEVLHNGVWGTVCGDLFAVAEARVVCKMLGLDSGTKTDNSNYITNDGPIWLDDLRCNGTETDIAECSHNGWSVHNCQHREDVAVSCARVQVRLNGGRDPREGRLEVFYNGLWGSVCDGGSYNDHRRLARLVCNMLGFGYSGRPYGDSYGYGFGPFWLDSVSCSGTEKNIAECRHNGWGVSNCDYYSILSVSCLKDYSVALFGGGSPREGRFEMHYSSNWGTICDDGFTDAAARVVCYSLGFGYVGREMNISVYGVGKGEIWFDDVHCEGNERGIDYCSHRGWGIHNCGHNEDVAVFCFRDSSATTSTLSASTTSSASTTTSTSTRSSTSTTSTTTTASATSTSSMSSLQSTTSSTLSTLSLTFTTNSITSMSSPRSVTPSTSVPTFMSTISSKTRSISTSKPYATTWSMLTSPEISNTSSKSSSETVIIAAIVVAGLIIIICVIVIGIVAVYFRKHPRRGGTDVAMIPVPLTAPTNTAMIPIPLAASTNNDDASGYDTLASTSSADNDNAALKCGSPAADTQVFDNNVYSSL